MKYAEIRGYSVWGVSLNLLLLGALLVMAPRVVPTYIECLTGKDLIPRAADECGPRSEAVDDLKVRLPKMLSTNQIYDPSIDDIEVDLKQQQGAIVNDANSEKRFPVFWILDGVMKFGDLISETASTGRT